MKIIKKVTDNVKVLTASHISLQQNLDNLTGFRQNPIVHPIGNPGGGGGAMSSNPPHQELIYFSKSQPFLK